MPLRSSAPGDVSRNCLRPIPGWCAVECRGWAKYLGFVLGPDRAERTWDQACSKALQRARLWRDAGLGLQWSALVYQVYVASVLGFLLQLDRLPSHWDTTEASLLRALVPGPYRWCAPADLHGLRRDLGFAREFPDLRMTSIAARLRVYRHEAAAQGGLPIRRWLLRLAAADHRSQHLARWAHWRQWHSSSFCHYLASAPRELAAAGVSGQEVRMRAAQASCEPITPRQVRRERKRTQRAAVELLRVRETRRPEVRMRRKLESWALQLYPRLRAQRALLVLPRLAAIAPPRVSAAVLRTWWSGWCTRRRFGTRGPCVFCGRHDLDSVEHASVCRVLAEFGRDHLCLQYHAEPDARRLQFLLLEPASWLDDRRLLLGALRIAAAYRVHCKFRRHARAGDDRVFIRQALAQAAREALLGHTAASAAYDSRWAAARATLNPDVR